MGGFSRFFIYRPIFAMVISIVVVLLGGLSIPILPVESMPNITPPTVQVSTSYPGASAEVLAETVAQPIEQEVNGVEDMIFMNSSKSPATGTYGPDRSASRSVPTSTWRPGSDAEPRRHRRAEAARGSQAAGCHDEEEVDRDGRRRSRPCTRRTARSTSSIMSNYVTTQIKDVLGPRRRRW